MWTLYKLNKDASKTDIFTTMDVLYSKLPKNMSLNKAIQMYSYGLSYARFPAFMKFVMELAHASR